MNSITDRFGALTLTGEAQIPATAKSEDSLPTNTSRDYARLIHLQITDSSATVSQDLSFNPTPTQELLTNLAHFLKAERSSGYNMLTVIKAILRPLQGKCYPPTILGQDIKSLLGWKYLSQKYLELIHQRDNTLQLEDCLSPETLALAKADCKKAAENLTIRIPLLANITNHLGLLESLHSSLKLILKDSLSDLSTQEPSSFYYESTIDGAKQRIRFEFPIQPMFAHVTSGDAVQLLLTHEFVHGLSLQPIVTDNRLGNQWCVDTMLKVIRVYNPSNHLSHQLFEYFRSGYDPRGHVLECVRGELQTVDAESLFGLWKKYSDGHSANKERLAQNALLLCQACSKIPLSDSERSSFAKELSLFITQAFDTVDAKGGLWHASLALLQQELISVNELESLLQLFGIAACRLQSKADVQLLCSAPLDIPTLSIQSLNKGAECVFQIPLHQDLALSTFARAYERIKDHECTRIIVDAIFKGLSAQRKPTPTLNTALEPILPSLQSTLLTPDSQPGAYLPSTLLAAATGNTPLFTKALQGLVPAAHSATVDSQHTIGAALRVAFLAQEIELPEQMQNGGLQESTLKANWAAYLLSTQHTACYTVGRELLAEAEGNAPLKATWIYKSLQKDPELALRLIKQVENDPCIQESHVKQWLQKSPHNAQTLIWHYLVRSDRGRWLKTCAVTCPRYVHEAFSEADLALCATLRNAALTEDTPKDEYRSLLLPYVLDPHGIDAIPELIEGMLMMLENPEFHLTKKEKEFFRTNLKAFVAQAQTCSQQALGVRFIKVYHTHACGVLDQNDKLELLQCAQEPLSEDLAAWYLSLRGEVLPFKLEPALQCRVFMRIVQDHPSCIVEADSSYVRELYTRIQSEAEKTSLREEIPTANPNLKELFKAFYPVKKETRQAVQPATTKHSVPAKKAQPTAESWIRKLKRLADELSYDKIAQEICTLLKSKDTLSDKMNRQIWRTILENPHWLNSTETLAVFEQIEFFKSLFSEHSNTESTARKLQDHLAHMVDILLNLLKATPQHVKRYLPYAYLWYELVPAAHKSKMPLGLSLLDFYTPTDSVEAIRSACAIVDGLHPHLERLYAQKVAVKKQQRNNKLQPSGPPLDGLIRFCIIAKAPSALEVAHDTVLRLVTALGSQEAEAAHRFAIGGFGDHPSLDVKEALWPSIKEMMAVQTQSGKNDSFALQLAKAHTELLKAANVTVLLSMFESRFEGDSPKNQAPDNDYGAAYNRLLTLCADTQEPEHAKRALVLDCNIREFYARQAQAIQRDVKDYSTLRLRLLLKLIQYNPWSKDIKRLFSRFIALPLERVDATRDCEPFYVATSSARFYSYDPSERKILGSICPATKPVDRLGPTCIPEPQPAVHSLIYSGLRYACEQATTLEQKKRLLDFTVQNIRNLMEHYPHVGFHVDCIKMFAQTIWPEEHQLWETHRSIVFALLRTALNKKILSADSEKVKDLLEHINRSRDELEKEDLTPLEGIRQALSAVTPENVAQVLLEQQRALITWQETAFVSSYQVRQELLDLLFGVWHRHPEMSSNPELLQSLASLIAPNSLRFGQNNGPEGWQAANKALESYLDFYLSIYYHTKDTNPNGAYRSTAGEMRGIVHFQFTEHGTLASKCLGVLVDEFAHATKFGAYSGNYDGFIARAKKLMPLFRSPSYLSVVSIAPLAGKLTTTLLSPVKDPIDEVKRVALVHEWLQHMRTHIENDDFYSFGDPVFQRIIRSDILYLFSKQEHMTLAGCLNRDGKNQLLVLQAETIKKSQTIPVTTMECLEAIHQSLQREDGGRSAIVDAEYKSTKKADHTTLTMTANGRVALRCLELMTDALQKEGASKNNNFSIFATMLMQLLSKPCYLGIQATAPLLGRIVEILITYVQQNPQDPSRVRIIHDWLQLVLSHKGDTGHIALLHHTMQSLINGQLIKCFNNFDQEATQTLHACLQDWQTSGIKISDELISKLIVQQKADQNIRGIDALTSN